jgi:hypothetical protein
VADINRFYHRTLTTLEAIEGNTHGLLLDARITGRALMVSVLP